MVLDRTPPSLQSVKLDDEPFARTVHEENEEQGESFGLPEPWERRRDPDGNVFYINKKSKETQWNPPPGLYSLRLVENTSATYTVGLNRAPEPPAPPAPTPHIDASALATRGKFQRPTLNQDNTSTLKSLVGYAYHSLFSRKESKDHREKLVQKHYEKKAAARRRRIAALEHEKIEEEEVVEETVWGYVKVAVSEGFGINVKGAKTLSCRVTLRKPDRTKVDSYEKTIDLKKDKWDVKAEFVCHDPLSTVVISVAATVKKVVHPVGKVELQVRETLDQWRDLQSQDGGDKGMILVLLTHKLSDQVKKEVIDEALPAGWQSKVTPDGRIFYVDVYHRSTQWAHPVSNIPVPKNWIKRTDAEGRVEYVEIQAKKQFAKDFVENVRYTHPDEPPDALRAREDAVAVLNGLTDLLEYSEGTYVGDRAALEGRTDYQYAKAQEMRHKESVDWESFEGRLASFNREAHGCELTVWPHGKHRLRDRQAVFDELVGFAQLHKKPVPRTLRADLPLHTDIPSVEGHFFKRKGKAPSLYWEEFYVELRVDAGDAEHVHFVWGELDPWTVHQTGRVLEAHGGVMKSNIARTAFCARSQAEVAAINAQFSHRDLVNIYGFDIQTSDGTLYNFAGQSLDDCKKIVSILGGRPMDVDTEPPFVPHSPKEMARAGLFFAPCAQFPDRVECGLCGVHLSQWQVGEAPAAKHKARSPACKFFEARYKDQPPKMMLADIKKKEVMIHKVIIDEPEEELGRTGSGAGVIERTPSLIKMVESGFFATAVRTHSLPTELSYEEALTRGDHLRKQRQRLQKLMLGGQYGEELLSLAVSNDLAGVKRLLVMGAPVNVQDGGLRTPLHWAAAMGNTSIVSVLISYGADVDARTVNGFTPLMLARNAGFEACIGHLVLAGAEE